MTITAMRTISTITSIATIIAHVKAPYHDVTVDMDTLIQQYIPIKIYYDTQCYKSTFYIQYTCS